MSDSDDPLLGRTLDGRYRLDAKLGQGAMGAVYRARQLSVDRDVAIKVLRADRDRTAEQTRRFQAEARIIARLRHPHTVRLIDFGQIDDDQYLVMELVQGESLATHLRSGDLSPFELMELLAQVADALTEAHGVGIVHRDLKPANIVVERVGGRPVARILDFGVAKVADEATATRTGAIIGTPAYMAPEQVRSQAIGPAADLYALGVTAFEALAGLRPLRADSSYGMMMKQVEAAPLPLAPLVPSTPAWRGVAELVMSMLAKAPADRPADAGQVRDRLRALAAQIQPASSVSAVMATLDPGTDSSSSRSPPSGMGSSLGTAPAPVPGLPDGSSVGLLPTMDSHVGALGDADLPFARASRGRTADSTGPGTAPDASPPLVVEPTGAAPAAFGEGTAGSAATAPEADAPILTPSAADLSDEVQPDLPALPEPRPRAGRFVAVALVVALLAGGWLWWRSTRDAPAPPTEADRAPGALGPLAPGRGGTPLAPPPRAVDAASQQAADTGGPSAADAPDRGAPPPRDPAPAQAAPTDAPPKDASPKNAPENAPKNPEVRRGRITL